MTTPLDVIIKSAHAGAKARIEALLLTYGATREHLDIRHAERLDAILDATTPQEASKLALKAESSVFYTLMALWGDKKIPGRITSESIDKKISSARSLAAHLEREAESKYTDTAEKKEKLLSRAKKQHKRAEWLIESQTVLRTKGDTAYRDFIKANPLMHEEEEAPPPEPKPKKIVEKVVKKAKAVRAAKAVKKGKK